MKKLIKPIFVVMVAAVLLQVIAPTVAWADPDNVRIYREGRFKVYNFEFYGYNVRQMKSSYRAAWNNAHEMVWRVLDEDFPNLEHHIKAFVAGIAKPYLAYILHRDAKRHYQFGRSMYAKIRVDTWEAWGVRRLEDFRQAWEMIGLACQIYYAGYLTPWISLPQP